jgi:hypothetical protein
MKKSLTRLLVLLGVAILAILVRYFYPKSEPSQGATSYPDVIVQTLSSGTTHSQLVILEQIRREQEKNLTEITINEESTPLDGKKTDFPKVAKIGDNDLVQRGITFQIITNEKGYSPHESMKTISTMKKPTISRMMTSFGIGIAKN